MPQVMKGINILRAVQDAARKEQQNATFEGKVEEGDIAEHQDGNERGKTTETGRGDSHEQSGEVEEEKVKENAEEKGNGSEREITQETQRRKKHR